MMRLCTWKDSSTTLAADNERDAGGGDFERSKSALLWMGAAPPASERRRVAAPGKFDAVYLCRWRMANGAGFERN